MIAFAPFDIREDLTQKKGTIPVTPYDLRYTDPRPLESAEVTGPVYSDKQSQLYYPLKVAELQLRSRELAAPQERRTFIMLGRVSLRFLPEAMCGPADPA